METVAAGTVTGDKGVLVDHLTGTLLFFPL